MKNTEIIDAVIRRACGYETREVVEEYAVTDGELTLVKRKVTTKDVPPDMTAAKMLMDGGGMTDLTDEQLNAEKVRLLTELLALDKKEHGVSKQLG